MSDVHSLLLDFVQFTNYIRIIIRDFELSDRLLSSRETHAIGIVAKNSKNGEIDGSRPILKKL